MRGRKKERESFRDEAAYTKKSAFHEGKRILIKIPQGVLRDKKCRGEGDRDSQVSRRHVLRKVVLMRKVYFRRGRCSTCSRRSVAEHEFPLDDASATRVSRVHPGCMKDTTRKRMRLTRPSPFSHLSRSQKNPSLLLHSRCSSSRSILSA